MKKLLISIVVLLAFRAGYGQTMQASIGAGATSNSIRVYLRPSVTQTPATFSTLQFNVAIPTGINPIPTLTLVNSAFAGVTWIIDAPYVENGYLNYNIYTANAGYTLPITINTEFSALELAFIGGPAGPFPNTAHLVTQPDGGVGGSGNGFGLYYCTGTINSNGQSLYYARDVNVVFANGDSYRYTPPATADGLRGTFTSFARFVPPITLSSGTVPVTFTNYDVKCNDKGALLTWATATEQNSDRFEIQRSINGTDWITVDKVKAAGNSADARAYQYLDLNGGAAFYRIRQVDMDGRFTYTAIKQTNCKAGQFDVVLYPVPAKDNITVVIKSDVAVRTDLQIVDMGGRTIRTVPTQVNKGNNTINLNVADLSVGQYILVSSDPSITINKKFTIMR